MTELAAGHSWVCSWSQRLRQHGVSTPEQHRSTARHRAAARARPSSPGPQAIAVQDVGKMWLCDVAHPLWVMPSSSSPGVEIGCPQTPQRVTQRRHRAWRPNKRATTCRRSLRASGSSPLQTDGSCIRAIDQMKINGWLLPLVRVVETRGIEPLTPALQRRSVTRAREDCAGQADVAVGWAAPDGCGRTKLGAIAGDISSSVDDQTE